MLRTIRSIHSSVVNSAAKALVFLQVESGDLDRRQLVDPEGVLALAFLVIGEAHLDLGPDAAGQQALEIPHIVGRDMDELVAEIVDLRPVVGVDKPHLHLVDERMAPVLLDLALRLHRLVGADVVVGEGVVDDLQPHLDRHLVRGGAIFPEEELQNEHGNVGARLDLADEILADDLARENPVRLVVERVARGSVTHDFKLRDERGCLLATDKGWRRYPRPRPECEAPGSSSLISRKATVTGLPGSTTTSPASIGPLPVILASAT